MAEARTVPALLLINMKTRPEMPAIREKLYGIWETWDWQDYADNVRASALSLKARGFGKGDKLAVIGDNRPHLYWAQLAAMCLGGAAVPVYQDSIARELAFVLNHAEAKVVVAEDQEQADKILSIRDELPALELIVYSDPRGMTDYDDDMLAAFSDLLEAGRTAKGDFEALCREVAPEDIGLICYTSGTTGRPKGVMLSHDNLVQTAEIYCKAEDVREGDDYLAYLPMAWVGDSLYGLCAALMVGSAINCPESPETLRRDLRELSPMGIIAPPRMWETMLSDILVRASDSSALKRRVFNYFRNVAEDMETCRVEGKPISSGLRMRYRLGEFLVYGPVRDQLGFRRTRWALTGGAPLGPDTFRFFRSFGVNLKQVYGSTEVTGVVSVQPDGQANPDTVGPVCDGVTVRIADTGEILVKSPGVFNGYYKAEEATAEAFDEEGWFRTGDAGLMDERGHIVVIDRAKDVGLLSDGSAYAPQFIENKLKFSPYISEAVSFGDKRPFICAMVAIDLNTVGNWAERQALTYTNYMDLSQKPETYELIRNEIERINRGLPEAGRVKRFLLLGKDLDADDAEITRTRKLRRGFIADKYADVIRAFYSGGTSVELRTAVTFEDGREALIDNRMQIQDAA